MTFLIAKYVIENWNDIIKMQRANTPKVIK